jgi:hypothetical protein
LAPNSPNSNIFFENADILISFDVKDKTNIKAFPQKKKEETKTKNVCLFNWPFAGNRKKKQQLLSRLMFVLF